MSATQGNHAAGDNRRLLVKLSIVASLMFGFGYALVPFYKQVCIALGLNSLEPVAVAGTENTQVDYARDITIEFDANAHNLPWHFRAMQNHISVHPGELTTVEYEVVNPTSATVTGQAVPSYGPQLAGQYFSKLECFCFSKQTFAPGEKRRMQVVFLIDPKLPADVHTITLSYTFFEVAGMGGKT
ncbi:MAG: cytochrome c oxidase assembly protein [Proteobacteria bacterium]|nr:cytochrome c oxidase assembly protein [Pseudomonadota bacterium]